MTNPLGSNASKYLMRKIAVTAHVYDSQRLKRAKRQLRDAEARLDKLEKLARLTCERCEACDNPITPQEYSSLPTCYWCDAKAPCRTWEHTNKVNDVLSCEECGRYTCDRCTDECDECGAIRCCSCMDNCTECGRSVCDAHTTTCCTKMCEKCFSNHNCDD
jgi:hypothetical protein